MNLRQDETTEDWPLRPWIMAVICALAGLLFHLLTDAKPGVPVERWRQAGATLVAVAAISFVLTVEQRRWLWSLCFAIGWGAVIAMVGWITARYNHFPTIFEWPFLSGMFAVLLAAPLFQTLRDEGAWQFPYAKLHGHAWTDAVIGAASLMFVGIAFALAWLIAGLFDLIGITLVKELLEGEWFGWMLAGFAFGTAIGLLRERDALAGTLQRLAMVVLSVLAPVLAVALVAFLASVPFTGLGELWDSKVPATPLMLIAGAGAILLANAVFGDGAEEKPANRVLRFAAPALTLTVLPMAIIAAVSLAQRIGQYGWTPERIWGVVAIGVALVYGLAGYWSVAKGRSDFDDMLRPLQVKMAIGLCALALLMALPVIDFGGISARSQLARLESGAVNAADFDYAAMAFDFGPAGRKRLERIAKRGAADQRELAANALVAKTRWKVSADLDALRDGRAIEGRLRLASPDIVMTDALRRAIGKRSSCNDRKEVCVLLRTGPEHYLLITTYGKNNAVSADPIDPTDPSEGPSFGVGRAPVEGIDLGTAKLELREVRRRQLTVDGKPVGEPFE